MFQGPIQRPHGIELLLLLGLPKSGTVSYSFLVFHDLDWTEVIQTTAEMCPFPRTISQGSGGQCNLVLGTLALIPWLRGFLLVSILSPLMSFPPKLTNKLGRYFETIQILLLLPLWLTDFDIHPCDESAKVISGEFA